MNHIDLLQSLIKTRSFSREEDGTASLIDDFLKSHGVSTSRHNNNIVAIHPGYDKKKKTVLLNSHHDTVKVNKGWTRDPFGAIIEDRTLYGLGSNDAGGCLVSLIWTFIHFYHKPMSFNLILAATAEEEIFGPLGLSSLIDTVLPEIHLGIIGEPTSLQLGVAEKGLIVIDAVVKGKAGHAARKTGVNAINESIEDLQFLKEFTFPLVSEHLGPVTMQVTQIESGYQHNIIPDECKYVIDVRVNEHYSNQEIVDTLSQHLKADLTPRSLKWRSKGIDLSHPIVKTTEKLGIPSFGSPTLSDQMHCNFPTVKIGPGDSTRSHTPDEHIHLSEIEDGVKTYISLLDNLEF